MVSPAWSVGLSFCGRDVDNVVTKERNLMSDKIYTTFSARISESFARKIEKYREQTDMTKSELMRVALREYMENHKQ